MYRHLAPWACGGLEEASLLPEAPEVGEKTTEGGQGCEELKGQWEQHLDFKDTGLQTWCGGSSSYRVVM